MCEILWKMGSAIEDFVGRGHGRRIQEAFAEKSIGFFSPGMRWQHVISAAIVLAVLVLGPSLQAQTTLLAPPEAETSAGEKLLLYWNFDRAGEGLVKDQSKNGLDGAFTTDLVDSPAGQAAAMNGTSKALVSVTVPEGKRFGKESWTFLAMVKPIELAIDEAQNQRRIFSFGAYPAANLVIDITGDGRLSWYFCYRDAEDKANSTGGSSRWKLEQGAWAHIALVCDRTSRKVTAYFNGFPSGESVIPEDFAGDFALGGGLTVGSGWHNYHGLVDEVKIFRSALSPESIDAEFERLEKPFAVKVSPEILAAKLRARLEKTFPKVNEAWAKGNFDEVRRLCRELAQSPEAPAHFQSYARLRIAQSHLAEKDPERAKAEYEAIAATAAYPRVHRDEARTAAVEIARRQQGLPARDPAATRTPLPESGPLGAEIFVAIDGSDDGEGTKDKPFASLERARDRVRDLRKQDPKGAIAVTVMPGKYERRKPFTLTAEDSGTESAPVIYRAEKKGAAVFYGGRQIEAFEKVTGEAVLQRLPEESRGKVWQCNLKALGIDDYGELKVRGFAQPPSPPTLELYVDGAPMTLARWPNEGFVGIGELIQPGSKENGEPSIFTYLSERPARWTQAADPWIFGYFHFLWADATLPIGGIDTGKKTLTTALPYHYGGRGMSTRQGIQYYAFNLLEEIDRPGEWYLERKTGMLYLFPSTGPAKSKIEIGMLAEPMVSLEGASHVILDGLGFDLARYNGIVAKDCEKVSLLGCTVSRFAGNGIMIHGGHKNALIGCDIHTIGRRATEVFGGDRRDLTPGGHLVENCRISGFGRIDRTYTPAIQLEGVGHRVAHNLMYKGPSSAMRIEGNDLLIEYNEVHSMVTESDDQGAFELFRNPTFRGVEFRHNYFHHIGKTGAGASVHGQAAIRFDDAISGMLVYGNVFYRCANGKFGAVQMNSGRDNLMDNNLFIDCKQGISGGWNPGNNVWKMLRAGEKFPGLYQDELHLKRYPQIATMLDEPGINHVWRNLFVRCGEVATRVPYLELFQSGVFEEEDPGFVDAAKRDFRLRDEAEAFQTVAFQPIPFEEIGLYESPARASWPVKTTPVTVPDWREAPEKGH